MSVNAFLKIAVAILLIAVILVGKHKYDMHQQMANLHCAAVDPVKEWADVPGHGHIPICATTLQLGVKAKGGK